MSNRAEHRLNEVFSSERWLEGFFKAVVKGPEGETYDFDHKQIAYRTNADGTHHILDNVVTDQTFEGLHLNVAIMKKALPGTYPLVLNEDLKVIVLLRSGFYFGVVTGEMLLGTNGGGVLSGSFSGSVSLGGVEYNIEIARFEVKNVPK
ncbi:hypothetical protein [Pseudomonas sp. SDO52101_S400]